MGEPIDAPTLLINTDQGWGRQSRPDVLTEVEELAGAFNIPPKEDDAPWLYVLEQRLRISGQTESRKPDAEKLADR